MDEVAYLPAQCPRCGKTLPRDAAEGLCPACLVAAGSETISGDTYADTPTMMSMPGEHSESTPDLQRLEQGQQWGPYRIGRLLGKGGMGEVYEAEHIETGRRLALKVLRSRLHHADDRARFLREGQLAASISHPHTVYIFGSEEISGSPVISMELLPGGTLKDQVVDRGPLPPTEAVSAILDIIGGLDAAQAAGVLHRDIKPSNCFVDEEGAVKVGDFGLSISTLARDIHHDLDTSTFQGTPQFAPPEQLRGEPLDVRADIYAVGATLYYLLTGQPVFDAKDLRELFQRVHSDSPKNPRTIRRDIPSGLAELVLQCLSKTPPERPASYAELANRLRPFAASDVTPAGLGLRLVAGMMDSMLVALPLSLWIAATGATLTDASNMQTVSSWSWTLNFAYFLVLEGFSGASPGKRLFGLRVVSATHSKATMWRVAVRTLIYFIPNVLITGGLLWAGGGDNSIVRALVGFVMLSVMFSTARRSNGFAGVHEVFSDTRVVSRSDAGERRVGMTLQTAPSIATATPTHGEMRVGPYSVVSEMALNDGRLLLALDPILRRHVWIRTLAPGTPAISAARRDLSRSGRLHWLTGRRSADENWDAFEAPSGEALVVQPKSTEWSQAKLQLLDLTEELSDAAKDGTLPRLDLDRLWLRSDGRLVLLDFPAANIEQDVNARGLTPGEFLSAIAARSLSVASTAGSLPLSARVLLQQWAKAKIPSIEEARASLAGVARVPNRVSRWRRAVPIALAASPIVLLTAFALLVLPTLYGFMNRNSEMFSLLEILHRPTVPPDSRLNDPEIRNAYETYLVGRYGETLRDDRFWNSPIMKRLIDRRPTAEDLLARHPQVSPEELAQATAVVEAERARMGRRRGSNEDISAVASPIIGALAMISVLFVLGLSILSSLIVAGGFVTRAMGLAVVTRDGSEMNRLRSLTRLLVAWSPAIAWLIYLLASPKIQGYVPAAAAQVSLAAIALGIVALGAIWAIVKPGRGLHDRLVGTWVVPR